jgi:hypothetical protein
MANPSVLEGTPRKNPQSPREKDAECELIITSYIILNYEQEV